MEVLGKLFGSEHKVRIMRLFLFNPETPFAKEDVAERARVTLASARRELKILRKTRLIKSRYFVKRIVKRGGARARLSRKKVGGLILNPAFPYLAELERLLLDSSLLKGDELLRRLNKIGKVKLVLIAGVFLQDTDSRVDLLVVGEHLRRGALQKVIEGLEAEIGKELRYAAFETGEFNYRLGMYDKLVRDILDYPHTVVLDRLGLPPMSAERR
ncbi:MAG: hypothetical protein AAB699_01445 [Patescibacteria group bacterium]